MENRVIKQILLDQKEEIAYFRSKKYISRELFSTIQAVNPDYITVISGVRRCGKSVLAHQLLADQPYAYVNFDDERFLNFEAAELNNLYQVLQEIYPNTKVLLLDEVQNVAGWELFVNRLQRSGIRMIVTGSNAHLLSKELATHLTGRHILFELYPFSFSEFLQYQGTQFQLDIMSTSQMAEVKRYFQDFVSGGGFPLALNTELSQQYLRELYRDILERDIVTRHRIRRVEELYDLSLYGLTQFGSRISYNQLQKVFDIKSPHTIKKYLSYCEDAYLLSQLSIFSFQLKKRMTSLRKIYAVDSGMINALTTQHSPNNGRLLENIVCIEFKRRKQDIYFYVTKQGREVDFVVHKNKKITQLVQVCYQLDNVETRTRELKALVEASTELFCNELTVLTEDTEGEEVIQGKTIHIVPVWKWLLVNKK